MNEASELVANSVLEANFKTIILGGKAYVINEPTIKILCYIVQHWCYVQIPEEPRGIDVIASIPINAPCIIRGLSAAIVGDVRFCRIRAFLLSRRLMSSTSKELSVAVPEFVSLLNAEDFFGCAISVIGVAKMIARPK